MLSHKNIAFVYTAYQQNVLFSICLQENIYIETLFIRKNISLHKNSKQFVNKVVYYEDIPFSWRSIRKFYLEYKRTIAPHLDIKDNYRIFSWSKGNPLCRYAINLTHCKQIDLFEDGTGSYMDLGFNNYGLGVKTFVISSFIFLSTSILSRSMIPLRSSNIIGWSLFDNAYPNLRIVKRQIEHKYFQEIVENVLKMENITINIDLNRESVIFITSLWVEFGLLSNEEFIQVMIESVEKIRQHRKGVLDTIYWKLHPRTNIEDEKKRLSVIGKITNVHFEILQSDSNIEFIALDNREKALQYYSLGSSSLYVIKALVPKETLIFLIESDLLVKKLKSQTQLTQLYKSTGIKML